MLLIHGTGANWRIWRPVLDSLALHHDVLAVSLPGCGGSPGLVVEPSVPALVEAVERELDAAGWDRAHLVGSSLGGWIAAELALRGRAASLTLVAPSGRWTDREWRALDRLTRSAMGGARLAARWADLIGRWAPLRTIALLPIALFGWRLTHDDVAYFLKAASASSTSVAATLDWISRHRAGAPSLADLDVATSILWGRADLQLPVRQCARWQADAPHVRARVLALSGHVPMIDAPRQTVAVVLETARRAR